MAPPEFADRRVSSSLRYLNSRSEKPESVAARNKCRWTIEVHAPFARWESPQPDQDVGLALRTASHSTSTSAGVVAQWSKAARMATLPFQVVPLTKA